jgi:hypothetical protein
LYVQKLIYRIKNINTLQTMLFSVESILKRSLLLAGMAFAAQACDEMSGDVIPTDEEIDRAVDLNAAMAVNGPVLVDLVQAAKLTGPSTISIVKDPTKGTVEILNSALLLYTPNKDFTNGTDQVVYSVCGDGHCDEGKIDFTYVSDEAKCYSMAVPDAASGKATDEYIFVDVLKNDILCDDTFDKSTVKIVNQPPAGEAKIIDAMLFYYPAADYVGPVYIVYSVAGRANPNTLYYGMATITVQPAVPTFQAVNDVFNYTWLEYDALLEADPYTIVYPQAGIFGNDLIGEAGYDDLTVEIVEGPATGTVIFERNLGFFFRPSQGHRGSDSFTYKICYNGECSQATVSINVGEMGPIQAVNDEIVYTHAEYLNMLASYDALNIPFDRIINNDVFSGIPINRLTFDVPQQPSTGSVQIYQPDIFRFYPDNDFGGRVTFIYTICSTTNCTEATVTIIISDWPQ